MKLKLVIVDLELSTRQKRGAAAVAAIASLLGGGSAAIASVPHAFVSGELLKAADLNANFSDLEAKIAAGDASLDARLAALEEAPAPLTVVDLVFVPDGEPYKAECWASSGTFPEGACSRMAYYYCVELGYASGWFEGDVQPDLSIGVACTK